jgi:hypothetical protein
VTERNDELRRLKAAYDDLQAQITIRNPRYATLVQPQPLSVRDIQQQVLDNRSILLEYALGDENSYLWALTREKSDELCSSQASGNSKESPTGARIDDGADDFTDGRCRRLPTPCERRPKHSIRMRQENSVKYCWGRSRISWSIETSSLSLTHFAVLTVRRAAKTRSEGSSFNPLVLTIRDSQFAFRLHVSRHST